MELKNIVYRRIDFSNDEEMLFIVKTDIQIPASYEENFPTDQNAILNSVKFTREHFSAEDFFDLALNDKNEIIGFHAIKKMPHYDQSTIGHIYTLWVSPEYRQRGIARALKLRGENWAKSSNIKSLHTETHVTNSKMLALNEQLGFRPHKIKMIKEL